MEKCKVCGKLPKVSFDGNGNCIVRCKPFLKRTHWTVEAPNEKTAVSYWNDRMKMFKQISCS